MNAGGLIMISLGLILIVIGVKGSQHNVLAAFTGKNKTQQSSTTPSGGTVPGTPAPQAGQPANVNQAPAASGTVHIPQMIKPVF